MKRISRRAALAAARAAASSGWPPAGSNIEKVMLWGLANGRPFMRKEAMAGTGLGAAQCSAALRILSAKKVFLLPEGSHGRIAYYHLPKKAKRAASASAPAA